MKLDIIAGARPNFMKISPIIRQINKYNTEHASTPIEYRLIHTGQHYDQNMSGSFFDQLEIPAPHLNLGAGSGSQATQTSQIMIGYEKALEEWKQVRDQYDSLVAVKPFKGHLLDEKGNPVNYAFGYWHKVSQDLPKQYSVLWSLFILKRETVKRYQYHIGVNPYLFETDTTVVDIDYDEDFELAQIIYQKIHGVIESL